MITSVIRDLTRRFIEEKRPRNSSNKMTPPEPIQISDTELWIFVNKLEDEINRFLVNNIIFK